MRIREAYNDKGVVLDGIVESDESYFGGILHKMNKKSRKRFDRGNKNTNKQLLMAMKERDGKTIVYPIANQKRATLFPLIRKHVKKGATVFTDEAPAYDTLNRLGYDHGRVDHGKGEYVSLYKPAGKLIDMMASTNGVESFWNLLKKQYHGTHHSISFKHLGRYANECAGKQNDRRADTMVQMENMAKAMFGKRLTYAELVYGGLV